MLLTGGRSVFQTLFGDTWLYMPSAKEILEAFLDLNLREKSLLAASLLWLVILGLPLKGIDSREVMTGLTYVLFLVGSGVMLAASAPSALLGKQEFGKALTLMLVLSALSGIRWVFFYVNSAKNNQSRSKPIE